MKPHKLIIIFLLLISFIFPLLIVVHNIFSGTIAFWYDPARDFLLARDNLQKLSLIGPTSGIPGVFYGPYWIWLLSIGLLFSHDPRVVIFLTSTLPYFLLLPLLLWKFRRIFGTLTLVVLWLFFMLSAGMNYASNPWNPYSAPLLFILLIYLIVFTEFNRKGRDTYIKSAAIGLVLGLIVNFHISFGIGITAGTFLFFAAYNAYFIIQNKKKRKAEIYLFIKNGLLMIAGFILVFLPFFIFEIRHGFNQIQTAIHVLSAKGSVVTVSGLSHVQIIQSFFGTGASLLNLPLLYGGGILIILVSIFMHQLYRKKIILTSQEIKLILYIFITAVTIFAIYITSKNPVWNYHFIGVEVLFLFLIGAMIHKTKIVEAVLCTYVLILLFTQIPGLIKSFYQNPLSGSTLASTLDSKIKIVNDIHNDAEEKNYTVYAYSPSIYTYEYSYLFYWIAKKDVPYDPGMIKKRENLVYLIIPRAAKPIEEDFINNKTPEKEFKTTKTWNIAESTFVLRREKYEKN